MVALKTLPHSHNSVPTIQKLASHSCSSHLSFYLNIRVRLRRLLARSGDVYRLAKQMRCDNQDVMGEKPVKNDAGQLSLDEE